MPCLNEAETLAACIAKAQRGLERAGVTGEVLVADNGSTDGSIELAESSGARVVKVARRGYGEALQAGIEAARGRWILMGDADDSYDFSEAPVFVEKLRAGYDLVMGCRLPAGGGEIRKGAMPWKNRWIGNPVLSFIGRLFFRIPIRDFHCGLRAFDRAAVVRMEPRSSGMEFASELVMKAALLGLRVAEVPITLHPDGRSRPPHLRPWRDGWRHLRFMLIFSPRWLFLMPGLLLAIGGALAAVAIYLTPVQLGEVNLDAGTLVVVCSALIVGVQLAGIALFARVFAANEGLLPRSEPVARLLRVFSLERGLVAGAGVLLTGLALLGWAVWLWAETGFGHLPYEENLRRVMAAATCIIVGQQIMTGSWFLSVLALRTSSAKADPPPPARPA
jgi:hypothetical protein